MSATPTSDLTRYLELGFGLVHVPPGTKAPRTSGWQDNPITTTDAAVDVWRQGGGIGLHHGASRTAVLDIDHLEWATLAMAAVDIDLTALLTAPGPKIRGAKGLKPVYRLPDGVELTRKALAWKEPGADKAVTVLELRAGKVQDVLPPSIHPDTGNPYTWEPDPPASRDDIPELPGGLLTLWRHWSVLKPALDKAQPWVAPPPPRTYKDAPEGDGVIGAFNARYTFSSDKLLEPRGYTPKGTGRWVSPHSASGLAGVVLLKGGDGLERVYCHHAADPLADEHAHDAFSAWCVLEHGGDVKAAVREAAAKLGVSHRRVREQKTPDRDAGSEVSEGKASTKASTRPKIVTNERHMREITADALAALEAANDPPVLYMRGTIPIRVNGDKIEVLTATSLKGRLDRVADFVKLSYTTDKETGEPKERAAPVRPPADIPPDILTQTELPFPKLEEIVHVPVFLPGGALLAEDGYNSEHALLQRLKGLDGLRADIPIDEALGLLEEVYGDFPFVERAGRAHTLAMTLQPFVRPLIQGATPMYLIDAPSRGTGKGLLAEVMNLIPLGYVVPTMSQPRDGDELEKRLTSVLLEARPIVFLDNVTRLGSEALHIVLTSETWQGRILGKSETVTVPNRAVWLASGNNVMLSDEMTRRVIPIRLDAGVERPEERTGFKHVPLAEYVRAHRSELVSACLSVVQTWIDAGMPKGKATLGRYEVWAGTMGGILQVCGVCGFLEGRERLHVEADKETTEWAMLCEHWHSAHGGNLVTAQDVFDVTREHHLLLDLWGGRSKQGALQRVGHILTTKRDRVFGSYTIRSAGRDTHVGSNAYRLERALNKTQQTQQNPQTEMRTPSGTQAEGRRFSAGFEALNLQDPPKPAQNSQTRNAVQDATPDPSMGEVQGLRGFEAARRDTEPADLSHLLGATEGEL